MRPAVDERPWELRSLDRVECGEAREGVLVGVCLRDGKGPCMLREDNVSVACVSPSCFTSPNKPPPHVFASTCIWGCERASQGNPSTARHGFAKPRSDLLHVPSGLCFVKYVPHLCPCVPVVVMEVDGRQRKLCNRVHFALACFHSIGSNVCRARGLGGTFICFHYLFPWELRRH